MAFHSILNHLQTIVGTEFVSNDPIDLYCYTGNLLPVNPQYIIRPGNIVEVIAIIEAAVENNLPIIPRGFGTRSTPRRPGIFPSTEGGLILDTGRLKTIRKLDLQTREITVEAGVTIAELANYLAPKGWRVNEGTMAPFCATVGALTGVGPGLRKYGRRENSITNIELVTGTGEIISTSSLEGGGMDLTKIITAAQGLVCLGITTAVTFKIFPLPEKFEYINIEFKNTSAAIKYLREIDNASSSYLPGVFQVNIYPEAVFQLYARMPVIRNQNCDYKKMLDRYPPFPSDVVGIVIEGTSAQISIESGYLIELAKKHGGEFIGPEPVRDYYVNRNWNGNTKCHEDVSRLTTSWTEPFFICAVEDYGKAKKISEQAAVENGFLIGERYWARGTLRDGILGYTSCVTFDDTSIADRENATRYFNTVVTDAGKLSNTKRDDSSIRIKSMILDALKSLFDPSGILFPGILYMD